jgi:hypothetical protein
MLALALSTSVAACAAEVAPARDGGCRPDRSAAADLPVTPIGQAAQAATTYYVRTDGGDASQCTGRADAAYPGSGTGKACAWKHPFYALSPSGDKRIAGGDILLIDSGSYMMGQHAPGATSCSGASCYLAAIPSGPSTRAPTRILGKSCSAPPRLWGTNGAKRVLNLDGSSNVEIGCLEVTDHDDCVSSHSNASAKCADGGDWATTGLYARASHNVWLHDLNIHGLAASGIHAGGLTDWTVERVKINKNGRVGWNFNIGSGSSNSGKIILRDIEIAWNGCGERVATGEPWACWAQQTGGYGDGLGTTDTGGQFLVEDAFVHHNTSDGLDFRYMNGAASTSVTLRRVYSVANAGNQVKVKGNSVIENSVLVSQCGYFKGRYYMLADDSCRASGNTLQLVFTKNNTAVVRHNTITGEGGVLIGATEGDSTNKVSIQNNVIIGFPTYRDPSILSSVYYANSTGAVASYAGNLVWKVKSNTCPPGSICGKDPKLTNMTLAAFDAEPLAGSPVIDKATMISAVTTDFLLQKRPAGAANDIGAYEMQPAGGTITTHAEFDFNGDGKSDVLWRNKRTGANAIWKSASSDTLQSMAGIADLNWEIVGADDFNGDGKSDVLWRNKSTGANAVWYSGSEGSAQALKGVTDLAWKIVGTGDFNGDGKADVLWHNNRTGANAIWKSGNYSTQQAMTRVTNLAWQIVRTGDFDGDGKSDVVWRNNRTGANTIWKSANSSMTLATRSVTDLAWKIVGAGDFNGDGKADVLWRNNRTGANAIWKSGSYNAPQAMTAVTNLAWQIVATGDFNGDGRSDVLWRNKSTGAGVIWKSASAGTSQSIGGIADLAWTVEP